jgi:hypothetical protein
MARPPRGNADQRGGLALEERNKMGCDIHTSLAVHRSSDGREYDLAIGNDVLGDRDYFFFALIAGVWNHFGIKPIAEPRGFPKWFNGGKTDEQNQEGYGYWGATDGDHSHSWLTVQELREVAARYVAEAPSQWSTDKYATQASILAICAYMDALRGQDEALFIFSFDN